MKSEKGAKSRQSTTPSSDTLKLPFRNSIHWQWKNVWSDQTFVVVVVLMCHGNFYKTREWIKGGS